MTTDIEVPVPSDIADNVAAISTMYDNQLTQVGLLTSDLASAAGTITTLQGQVTTLEAQIAAAPTTRLEWGLNVATNGAPYPGTDAQLIVATRAAYARGCGEHQKFYDDDKGISETLVNLKASGYGSDPSEAAPFMCWRGPFVKADFVTAMTWCAENFPGITWVCNDQEPENKSLTAAAYVAKVQAMDAAITATPALVGRVAIVPCLMAYQEIDKPNATLNWKTLVQPVAKLPNVIAVAWDLYDMDYYPATWKAAQYLSVIHAASQTLKLPYHLGEWGTTVSQKDATDTEAKRAQRAQDVITYMTTDAASPANPYGALGGCWWENYAGIPGNASACTSGLVKAIQAGNPPPVLKVLQGAMQ